MTVTDAPAVPSLSTAMREGSMAEHEAAEHSGFMTELLEGRLTEQAYADYLLRLRPVYAVLERVVREQAEDRLVSAVHDTALERLAAIDADLEHWVEDPAAALAALDSPAADAYAARIEEAAAWGGALLAHHYTRYLGDLSGGQAIGRILERAYGLEGRGVAFYDFAGIEKPKPYKDRYRASLDALALDEDETARVVEEVKLAFRLNQALFDELGANLDAYRR